VVQLVSQMTIPDPSLDPLQNYPAQILKSYQSRILNAILVASLLIVFGMLIFNIINWGRDPEWGTFNVITDIITVFIVIGVWWVNYRGRTLIASWIFIIITAILIPLSYSIELYNQAVMILAIPAVLSSLLIQPWVSFFVAALSTLAYTITYILTNQAFPYDYFSVLSLFVLALVSFLVTRILTQTIRQVIQAYDETIQGWSMALELRDPLTKGHSERVVKLTLQLARLLGVKDVQLIHLRRGVLLHDLGKMAVPDSILNKAGPLTELEWEVMRRHPIYAYQFLSSIDYLAPALEIPYCHHEKWDGTGYPRGLKGDQIPLSARIFAVIDVWDSLTSERVYRSTWSKEQALEYIRDQSGKYFDPRVVNTFYQVIAEGHMDENIIT
jgi:hypothetical protein